MLVRQEMHAGEPKAIYKNVYFQQDDKIVFSLVGLFQQKMVYAKDNYIIDYKFL